MDYLKNLMGDEFKEDLTVEQISNFLETKSNDEIKHYKELISKANGEAADYKRKWKATLSDQEQAAQEKNDELETLKQRCAELEKSQALVDYTSKYLELGYPKDLAVKSAEAQIAGDLDTLINTQASYIEMVRKTAVDKALDNTLKPQGSYVHKPVDYSEKISNALANGHPSEAAYYMRLQQEQKG